MPVRLVDKTEEIGDYSDDNTEWSFDKSLMSIMSHCETPTVSNLIVSAFAMQTSYYVGLSIRCASRTIAKKCPKKWHQPNHTNAQ